MKYSIFFTLWASWGITIVAFSRDQFSFLSFFYHLLQRPIFAHSSLLAPFRPFSTLCLSISNIHPHSFKAVSWTPNVPPFNSTSSSACLLKSNGIVRDPSKKNCEWWERISFFWQTSADGIVFEEKRMSKNDKECGKIQKIFTNELWLENWALHEWTSWWRVQRDAQVHVEVSERGGEWNWKWESRMFNVVFSCNFAAAAAFRVLITLSQQTVGLHRSARKDQNTLQNCFCSILFFWTGFFFSSSRSGLIFFTFFYNLICQFIASINFQYSFSIILK